MIASLIVIHALQCSGKKFRLSTESPAFLTMR